MTPLTLGRVAALHSDKSFSPLIQSFLFLVLYNLELLYPFRACPSTLHLLLPISVFEILRNFWHPCPLMCSRFGTQEIVSTDALDLELHLRVPAGLVCFSKTSLTWNCYSFACFSLVRLRPSLFLSFQNTSFPDSVVVYCFFHALNLPSCGFHVLYISNGHLWCTYLGSTRDDSWGLDASSHGKEPSSFTCALCELIYTVVTMLHLCSTVQGGGNGAPKWPSGGDSRHALPPPQGRTVIPSTHLLLAPIMFVNPARINVSLPSSIVDVKKLAF